MDGEQQQRNDKLCTPAERNALSCARAIRAADIVGGLWVARDYKRNVSNTTTTLYRCVCAPHRHSNPAAKTNLFGCRVCDDMGLNHYIFRFWFRFSRDIDCYVCILYVVYCPHLVYRVTVA